MEERHREILTTHHAEIVRDLRVADVIAELIGRKIVSPRQNEVLQALVLRGEEQTATAKLLAIVKSKGPQAFSIFCEVLREEYPHLADLLEAADRERVQAVEPERAEAHPRSSSDDSSDSGIASDESTGIPFWEKMATYLGYRPAKDPTLVTALISLLTTVERALMICLVAIDVVNWVRSERCSLEGILRTIVLPLVLHPSHNVLLFPVLASWFIEEKVDHLRDLTRQEGETTPEELRRYMRSVADALLLLIVLQTLAFSHAYYKHVYIGMEFRINILALNWTKQM